MSKFYIVPKEQEITINGKDKEDAIANFATVMDFDMNTYFKVLTEEEYQEYLEERTDAAAHKRFVTEFMKNELIENFDVPKDEAQDVAEDAYSIYENGDGQTEYECIEEAYRDWEESATA